MRRLSLLVAGIPLLLSCVRGEVPVPDAPKPASAPAPTVRVGLLIDTTEASLSANTRFAITGADGGVLARGDSGEVWTFRAEGTQLRAMRGGNSIGPVAAPVVVSSGDNGLVSIGGRPYRGSALLRVGRPGRVTAINVLELEEYLKGVVPFEIGRLAPTLVEAVKAQAVAARTYAIGNMNRWEERGFDFYATVMDQVYGGVAGEDSVASRAVLETRGEIVAYEGKPILAYYSSTCGGQTSAVEDVWPWRAGQPYLKSVPDTVGGTGAAYCQSSSRFRWTVAWTRDALRSLLAQTLGAFVRGRLPIGAPDPQDRLELNRVETLEVTGRTDSGRTRSLRIVADGRTHEIRADSIRWVLRPEIGRILNSSRLLDLRAESADGEVQRLEVHGGGWGHGVGMCQVGAINRARAGQGYRRILTAYYSGTEIQRLY